MASGDEVLDEVLLRRGWERKVERKARPEFRRVPDAVLAWRPGSRTAALFVDSPGRRWDVFLPSGERNCAESYFDGRLRMRVPWRHARSLALDFRKEGPRHYADALLSSLELAFRLGVPDGLVAGAWGWLAAADVMGR